MLFLPVNLESAKQISTWKYEQPYNFYDHLENENGIKELLNGTYYAVKDSKNELIGYFCFGESAQVRDGVTLGIYSNKQSIDIGLAMHPILTGKGYGKQFVQSGIQFAIHQFHPKALRLSVATFNQRAITVYEKIGFRLIKSFKNGSKNFQLMEYQLENDKNRKR
ncbi:GNAT family N-acetyltransferase [Radiobacillus sp. PE A8.2]|uniref:GNAT family N-acetyltransferase n=1 Tax=Radiobacillus sp. PE A8.2 TaxID=3380349 RepID=UPI0038901F11